MRIFVVFISDFSGRDLESQMYHDNSILLEGIAYTLI
jgi:hypothetical protein